MKKIVAIVVTYNRKVLLKEALLALKKQLSPALQILIVDNASTDGTFDFIQSEIDHDHVLYLNTHENIGGAGGFYVGIKEAYRLGADYVWLLDDDTICNENTLSELLIADELLKGQYGFLASSVLWIDGNPCEMNKQKISSDWYTASALLQHSLLKTYYSTFVSMFIKMDVIKKVGLPYKEFFIWGDDVEYSNRIAKIYPCYIVGKSQVTHKIKDNNGSNIIKDSGERIQRYRYAYRNECVIARANGLKGRVRQFCKINYHLLKLLTSSSSNKLQKFILIIQASLTGIRFRPQIEYLDISQESK